MKTLKDILICILLLSGTWLLIEVSLTARMVSGLAYELNNTIGEIRLAATEIRGYNTYLRDQLSDPKTQRGLSMLLRSGDDLSRTIKRANVILENLNDAIRNTSYSINGRLVPSAIAAIDRTSDTFNNQALSELERTLQATTYSATEAGNGIRDTASSLNEALAGINRSIGLIETRISDPKFDSIISNIDVSTSRASETMLHIETKTKELTKPVAWAWRGIKSGIVIIGRIFIP